MILTKYKNEKVAVEQPFFIPRYINLHPNCRDKYLLTLDSFSLKLDVQNQGQSRIKVPKQISATATSDVVISNLHRR